VRVLLVLLPGGGPVVGFILDGAFEEEEPLADSVVPATELFIAVVAEAEATTFLLSA